MSADIILVKHLFPYSAGDFAYAAVLARMIFFISQPFTIAMFPKVVSEKKEAKETIESLLDVRSKQSTIY